VALNILSGVWVAGIDAGKVYNTFPDMNGIFFSDKEYFKIKEKWRNFFENKFTV
jgi:cytochrome c oxidase assembly protein subunit 15